MNYTLTKKLIVHIPDVDKKSYINLFNSWLTYVKNLFDECKHCEIDIEIHSLDGFSATYNSISDFEKNYYDSSGISSCSFSIFLSKISHLTSDSPSICFNLYSNDECTLLVKTESQVRTSDVMSNIEKNINVISNVSELPNLSSSNINIESEINLPKEPIPITITSSEDEKKFVTDSYNASKSFTLKVTLISCILTAILSVIATIIVGKLT